MKRPDFQEKTEVKVIDRGHHLYSKRGIVTARKALPSGKWLSTMSLWKKLRHGTAQPNA